MAEEKGQKKKQVHTWDIIGRLIELLRILQENTDEYTTITQSEIEEKMRKNDHACPTRTLTDYVKVLMNELNPDEEELLLAGEEALQDCKITSVSLEEILKTEDMQVRKEKLGKFKRSHLRYQHIFSFDELNQLIEAVLFLKNINNETKENLIRKIEKLSSKNFLKYSPFISETTGAINLNISNVFEDSRIDDKVVKENLMLIQNAIEANGGKGCKIAFHFQGYNEQKELILRRQPDGKPMRYVVNPYYVMLYNGKYYLICCAEPYRNVAFYRIDLMCDITDKTKQSVLDKTKWISEYRKPKRDVKGLPLEWNDTVASRFQTEHMNMFYGEPTTIRIKIDHERYTLLHDYFGDYYEFRKRLDDQWDMVDVKCVPNSMESFAMQCSDYIEVLEPAEIRENIQKRCLELVKRYKMD